MGNRHFQSKGTGMQISQRKYRVFSKKLSDHVESDTRMIPSRNKTEMRLVGQRNTKEKTMGVLWKIAMVTVDKNRPPDHYPNSYENKNVLAPNHTDMPRRIWKKL